MKILFDHGTPVPLRRFLPGHEVSTAYELGWAELQNGELLAAAEMDFQAFITTDKNLRYQQNFTGRQLAILVFADDKLAAHSAAPFRSHTGGERTQAG